MDPTNPSRRPTPASGMPAALAILDADAPRDPDEIRAKPPVRAYGGSMEVGNEQLRSVVQDAMRPFVARLETVETTLAAHSEMYGQALAAATSASAATAKAAEYALEAKQIASAMPDETKKQIESALKIHKAGIRSAVDEGIQAALKPVVEEVGSLKSSTVIVARELGVERQLPEAVTRGVPAASKGEKGGSVAHVERQLRSSQIVQLVIAIGVVAKVLSDLFNPH